MVALSWGGLGVGGSLACSLPPGGGSLPGAAPRPDGGAGHGTPLVFGSEGNITVVSPDGRQRRALTKVASGSLARDPSWSPDGTRIAYSYTPPLPATRGPGGMLPLPVTDVYVMGADGSGARVLVDHGSPGVGFETPTWAPDGRSLYVTYTELVMDGNIVKDQVLELARVPIDGGTRQTLAPNAISPAVSPDGKRLAFVVTQSQGQTLLLTDADGKGGKVLVPPGAMEGLAAPCFSPAGRQIAFSAVGVMSAIPVPGTTPAPAQRGASGPPVAREGTPSLIRAMIRGVVGAAQAHGLPMDVFVVGAEGGAWRRLTELGEDNPAAAWSPDGSKIAILAGGGIYLVNADGSALTSIDQRGGHGKIDWRPSRAS